MLYDDIIIYDYKTEGKKERRKKERCYSIQLFSLHIINTKTLLIIQQEQ